MVSGELDDVGTSGVSGSTTVSDIGSNSVFGAGLTGSSDSTGIVGSTGVKPASGSKLDSRLGVDMEVVGIGDCWLVSAGSNGDLELLVDGAEVGVETSTSGECLSMVPVAAGGLVIKATAMAVRALMTESAIATVGAWELVLSVIISLVDDTLHGLLKQSDLMHRISDS